ncbi:endo-1,4-beta-xylanase [Parvularcula dongshanensis]|uniref:Beta-xylanase n=1 Tax=Parvularcula dongshanensis TaxID=1173995 RepID=A0A840I6R3_9PROT|nr:endo-1,4-beta-xylanase [Parvularcula dongshanensis]MBB4659933.1 endo-1,4-beta-xylanase [Parvularcula dongshanensis]
MANYSRRETLGLLAGATALGACATGRPDGSAQAVQGAGDSVSLDALARQKGLRFGTAINARQLRDPRYAEIVKAECGGLVAENEHKIYVIKPEPDAWNFAPADAIVDFAKSNDLAMRGHTLIWHHPRWLPQWLNETEFGSASEAEGFLQDYIGRVAGRYSPFLYSWDVVNETIDDETGEMRETSLSRAMGPEVIDACFRIAKEHAPNATLAYNDYMSWETTSTAHRRGVLRLLERLVGNGVPIDALGIQSHSNYEMPDEFTPQKQREWRAFVDEVVGMGLDIYLTEFDVNDTRLRPDTAYRDELIASYTKDYLDMMLSYEETKDVLAWGMVDKDSWLQTFLPREDGVEKRPTPYSSDYQPKAMREAIAQAFRDAPTRTPLRS